MHHGHSSFNIQFRTLFVSLTLRVLIPKPPTTRGDVGSLLSQMLLVSARPETRRALFFSFPLLVPSCARPDREHALGESSSVLSGSVPSTSSGVAVSQGTAVHVLLPLLLHLSEDPEQLRCRQYQAEAGAVPYMYSIGFLASLKIFAFYSAVLELPLAPRRRPRLLLLESLGCDHR